MLNYIFYFNFIIIIYANFLKTKMYDNTHKLLHFYALILCLICQKLIFVLKFIYTMNTSTKTCTKIYSILNTQLKWDNSAL